MDDGAVRVLRAVGAAGDETSVSLVADAAGLPQLAAAAALDALVRDGFVERRVLAGGLRLGLTGKGVSFLGGGEGSLRGVVASGVNEGKYLVSHEGYRAALRELLGADPFPGTLNVLVDEASKERFLSALGHVVIPGFSASGRAFGAVKYYEVAAAGVPCGLLVSEHPARSAGKVELVAPQRLRSALRVNDGDAVVIEAGE